MFTRKTMFTRKLITAIAAALTCGILALAGPAVAAPNDDAYGGVGSQEQAAAGGGGGGDEGGNGGEIGRASCRERV